MSPSQVDILLALRYLDDTLGSLVAKGSSQPTGLAWVKIGPQGNEEEDWESKDSGTLDIGAAPFPQWESWIGGGEICLACWRYLKRSLSVPLPLGTQTVN